MVKQKVEPLRGKKVLVVDDEPDIQDVMKLDFQWVGCDVMVASSGNEAIHILQTQPIDIVISDIRMNEGDGIDLLRWVRQHYLKNPLFVLVSAYPDLSEPEARKLGALTVLSKPYKFDFITHILEQEISGSDYSLIS